MPRTAALVSIKKPYQIGNFAGGLNTRDAPQLLQDSEATTCQNVAFDTLGTLLKRKGYTPYINAQIADAKVHSLYRYYKADGTKQLLAGCGTGLYKANTGLTGYDTIATGLSSSAKYLFFETFANYAIATNAYDAMKKWSGSALTDCTGAPTAQFVCVHKNYLFAAGNTTYPSRLYFSDLLSPDSWPAANYIDVEANDGEKITGIFPQFGNLVICKESSIHCLYGNSPTTFSRRRLYKGVGLSAPRSVILTEEAMMFLHRTGIYTFDSAEMIRLSDKVKPTITAAANYDYIISLNYDNRYYLAYNTTATTTNNSCLVFDFLHNAFSTFSYATYPQSYCIFNQADDVLTGLFGTTNGYVMKFDTGYNDNGTAIDMDWRGRHINFRMPENYKKVKQMFVQADKAGGTSLVLSYAKDGDTSFTDTSLSWTTGTGIVSQMAQVSSLVKTLQPKIRNNVIDVATKIFNLTITYLPKKLHT